MNSYKESNEENYKDLFMTLTVHSSDLSGKAIGNFCRKGKEES